MLLVGILIAGIIYWKGVPPEDLSEYVSTPDNSKITLRDVKANFGGIGLWSYDLQEALKQPNNQAILMFSFMSIAAAACFYLAHLWKRFGENEEHKAQAKRAGNMANDLSNKSPRLPAEDNLGRLSEETHITKS